MSQVNHWRIAAALQGEKLQELGAVLESVLPVRFDFAPTEADQYSGEIITEAIRAVANYGNGAKVCRLVVPPNQPRDPVAQAGDIRVRFSDDAGVPFPFRGRSLSCKVGLRPEPLKLGVGEKALLTCERGVIWAQSEIRGVKVFRSALALPEIPAQGNLHDVLNGTRFLELLPLIHFLRIVTGHYQWQRPPVRAQFMFDDPNLHWPTYGLVNYGEMATRAVRENYHVSFATVPLDAWLTNNRAAEIFRANPARLSLCVHGNNHTKKELAQNYTQNGRISLVHQAIRRIEKLEKCSGVSVSRVMVPPHGACSHEMLAEIPGGGFEAACISHGSLRSHNRAKPWAKILGYLPVEQIEGCPVLPRWGFVGTNENTILLAAFLDQAIVLRGHHQDLKGGIEVLDQFARIINGLGQVSWGNMAEISRQSHYTLVQGGMLKVRPWVNKVSLALPTTTTELFLENAKINGVSSAWQIVDASGAVRQLQNGAGVPTTGWNLKTAVLEKSAPSARPFSEENRLPAVAFIRRLLTEGRDRFQGTFGC